VSPNEHYSSNAYQCISNEQYIFSNDAPVMGHNSQGGLRCPTIKVHVPGILRPPPKVRLDNVLLISSLLVSSLSSLQLEKVFLINHYQASGIHNNKIWADIEEYKIKRLWQYEQKNTAILRSKITFVVARHFSVLIINLTALRTCAFYAIGRKYLRRNASCKCNKGGDSMFLDFQQCFQT